LEERLCGEHCTSERASDYDDELRKQSYFDNLIKEQFPPELVGENGTKRISSQKDEFAEILDERDQRRAEGAKEADHYGRGDER
jgi:hypothetical protein